MSTGINKVILIGNLGQAPDTRYMGSGECMTTLSLATTEKWKDKMGEVKTDTMWHKIVLFKKLAEKAAEFLQKGSKVYIEGRIRYRQFQDESGKKQWRTEIHCEHLQFLDARPKGETLTQDGHQNSVKTGAVDIGEGYDDDIPF